VKKAMMHAQKPNRKKNPMRKMMTIMQAKLCRGQTRAIEREWNNLIVKKESLHNNVKQWASNTKEDSKLLDNGSMLSLFGNPTLVTNIRESKTTLLELATNTGTRATKKIANVLDMVRCGMTKPHLRIYCDYPN
jgi:hypothetical protein